MMLKALNKLIISCLFFCATSAFSEDNRLIGVWSPNRDVTLIVLRPLIDGLPENKRAEFQEGLSRQELRFTADKLEIINFDGVSNDWTTTYRVLEVKPDSVVIAFDLAFPKGSERVSIIHFIGKDRIWIEGVGGVMEFLDRKN